MRETLDLNASGHVNTRFFDDLFGNNSTNVLDTPIALSFVSNTIATISIFLESSIEVFDRTVSILGEESFLERVVLLIDRGSFLSVDCVQIGVLLNSKNVLTGTLCPVCIVLSNIGDTLFGEINVEPLRSAIRIFSSSKSLNI